MGDARETLERLAYAQLKVAAALEEQAQHAREAAHRIINNLKRGEDGQ